jgi:hypothetical protein
MMAPGPSHTFPEPALFDEVALEAADLLIDKIVRLVNQADSYICHHPDWATLAEFAIVPIGRLRITSDAPDKPGLTAVFFPDRKVSYAE